MISVTPSLGAYHPSLIGGGGGAVLSFSISRRTANWLADPSAAFAAIRQRACRTFRAAPRPTVAAVARCVTRQSSLCRLRTCCTEPSFRAGRVGIGIATFAIIVHRYILPKVDKMSGFLIADFNRYRQQLKLHPVWNAGERVDLSGSYLDDSCSFWPFLLDASFSKHRFKLLISCLGPLSHAGFLSR